MTIKHPARLAVALLAIATGAAVNIQFGPGAISQAAAQSAGVTPLALPAQTNANGGVTVSVTPRAAAKGKNAWEFEVALTTHSGDLSQDLAKVAYLVDGAGRRQAPLGWEGSPPGGHHRKGVLRFATVDTKGDSLQLHIDEVGGVATRSFVWKLK